MAGGTWDSQNKLQPGVYINFKSAPSTLTTIGDRGYVTIAKDLPWGPMGEVVTIENIKDVYKYLGYDISSAEMLFMRQIFTGTTQTRGASTVYFYRLPTVGSAAAKATVGALTATGKYVGTRGNAITIIITADPDSAVSPGVYAVFTVDTVVDGLVQDSQTVGSFTDSTTYTAAKIGDLVNNDWVNFTGSSTAELEATAGTPLVGGTDGALATTAYSAYLTAIEPYFFNVIIYDGSDAITKSVFASFVKRLSGESGIYTQACMGKYSSADNETVISVEGTLTLNTGETMSEEEASWWVGGATAGAANYQSLTYAIHPDAVDTNPTTNSERNAAIKRGAFAFIKEFGLVKVLTDINTLTSFGQVKNKSFSKNRVIRVLWSIANDTYNTFSTYYIGKVDNNEVGRNLFKAEIIAYCNALQGNNAIQNFSADDVEVLPGNDVDSIVINLAVQPVDSVEKVYMTVTVN